MKKTAYAIPASINIPDDAKLQSGEEFTSRMVGAYYGSSYEFNCSISLQMSNGQNRECPADEELVSVLKPKYAHGEFGAEIASENSDLPKSKREIGRQVVELATIDEIRTVRTCVDRAMICSELTKSLRYTTTAGKTISYDQILLEQQKHRDSNSLIQKEKDQFLLDNNLAPKWQGGKKVSPAYPDWALEKIKSLNQQVWTATGVNLIVTFSGLHTIARECKFYTGRLDQPQLDQLAALLDYKECTSFFKGTVKSGMISIPIQTKQHLQQAISWLQNGKGKFLQDWPESVRQTNVMLEKVDRSSISD